MESEKISTSKHKAKKDLFYLFKTEADRPLKKIILMAGLSGIASTGSLALINAASQDPHANEINISHVLAFLSVVGIFSVSFRYILGQCIALVEDVLHKLRQRIAHKIRKTDLLNIEGIGKSTLYNRLTQELSLISQMAIYLIQALQSAVLLVCVTIYVGWLSRVAMLLVVGLVFIGALVLVKKDKIIMTRLKEADKADLHYFNTLTDIIDGLKEIKLNRAKGEDIFADFSEISADVRSLKIDTNLLFAQNMVFAQSYVFLVLGAIVFILPQFKDTFVQEILSTTTAMLFAIGPLSSLIATLPYYEKVNLCIANVYALEEELDRRMNPNELAADAASGENPLAGFREIELNNVIFTYQSPDRQDRFGVGPINLTIKRGETIFIVGGNGSGKTTLLKVLTTLYKADSGGIYIDDKPVDAANFHDFRELFSTIFYDFHLFAKLYGLAAVDQRKVDELLKLMEIDHKTTFTDGGFSRINLSTGQRKRLAMIVSMLEERPFYIFDEWAADQDPAFKDYFYNTLLQRLKEQGKTVIAVSHDDRYFDRADRIIKLEFGKIVGEPAATA